MLRLFGSEARIFEWIGAFGCTAWGLWLCNPAIDFTRPAYEIMAAFLPQYGWGGLIAALGVVQMVALYREDRLLRRRVLFCQFVVWVLIAIAIGWRNFYSTGFTTYFWIAANHGALWLRLAGHEQ